MTRGRTRRGSDVVWRAVPGFVTVASIDGTSVRASGSATAVWNLLPSADAEPIDVDEIVTRLAAEYRADEDEVRADTLRTLAAWEEIGCAVREP
ncbi:MAG: PqqD family protein [Ilumatobacter sp.]|uniref:PqqD family protein n=1 Tax=Ilumatobacter sp. TaxID=1967498 RepID=UPI003296D11F